MNYSLNCILAKAINHRVFKRSNYEVSILSLICIILINKSDGNQLNRLSIFANATNHRIFAEATNHRIFAEATNRRLLKSFVSNRNTKLNITEENVLVHFLINKKNVCMGTVIAPDLVLSTGHCFMSIKSNTKIEVSQGHSLSSRIFKEKNLKIFAIILDKERGGADVQYSLHKSTNNKRAQDVVFIKFPDNSIKYNKYFNYSNSIMGDNVTICKYGSGNKVADINKAFPKVLVDGIECFDLISENVYIINQISYRNNKIYEARCIYDMALSKLPLKGSTNRKYDDNECCIVDNKFSFYDSIFSYSMLLLESKGNPDLKFSAGDIGGPVYHCNHLYNECYLIGNFIGEKDGSILANIVTYSMIDEATKILAHLEFGKKIIITNV